MPVRTGKSYCAYTPYSVPYTFLQLCTVQCQYYCTYCTCRTALSFNTFYLEYFNLLALSLSQCKMWMWMWMWIRYRCRYNESILHIAYCRIYCTVPFQSHFDSVFMTLVSGFPAFRLAVRKDTRCMYIETQHSTLQTREYSLGFNCVDNVSTTEMSILSINA